MLKILLLVMVVSVQHQADVAPRHAEVKAVVKGNMTAERLAFSRVAINSTGTHAAIIYRLQANSTMRDTLQVYNIEAGKWLPPLHDDDALAEYVQFSPDGRRLAFVTVTRTAGFPRKLKVIDLDSGNSVYTFQTKGHSPHPCAFTTDSKHLVHSSQNGPGGTYALDLVELESAEVKGRIVPPREQLQFGAIQNVVVSADGNRILWSQGEWLSVWDLNESRELLRTRVADTSSIRAAAFSRHANRINYVLEDGGVVAHDLIDNEAVKRFTIGKGIEQYPVFDPSGDSLYLSVRDRIDIWDVDSGALRRSIICDKSPEFAVVMQSLAGEYLVSVPQTGRSADFRILRLPPDKAEAPN